MEELLTDEEKIKILQYYLGDFALYFDDEEESFFSDTIVNPDMCVLYSSDYNMLRKAVCYLLLKAERRLNYYYLKSNDILDKMLKDNDDPENEDYNFKDLSEIQLLIIYHPRIWKKNRILWETLNYLLETRKIAGKATIIITDAYNLSDEHGSLVCSNIINLDKGKSFGAALLNNSPSPEVARSIYED